MTKRKKIQAYTIIEVLVAIIILAIVLPGLATMVIASRKTQTSSLRMENATAYGQLVVDSLGLLPVDRVESSSRASVIDGQTYNASWIVSPKADRSKELAITVSWTVGNKLHSTILRGLLR